MVRWESSLSRCSQRQARSTSGESPRKPIILTACSNCETWRWPVMIWVVVSRYSAGPIIPRNGPITASGYVDIFGNRCILQSRCCFLPMMQFFKMTICPYTARSIQSWFEEHEDALQHLPWPTQSPDLNIVEPLEDVLHEHYYNIPLETIQTLWIYCKKNTRCITGKWSYLKLTISYTPVIYWKVFRKVSWKFI